MNRLSLLIASLALGLCLPALPRTALAQSPHVRFDVPASDLPAAIRDLGDGFENAWNALLVTEIQATLAGSDSAAALRDLETRVAEAEPGARGSSIARNALALRRDWTRAELRERLSVGEAEALANQARNRDEWQRADRLYEQALAGYTRLNERRRAAWVLGSMGAAAFNSRRYVRAESLYREALAARREIADPRMVGSSLNALGSTCYQMERYEDAYRWYHRARATREQTDQPEQLARSLSALGLTARATGRTDSAAVWYERALAVAVANGDSAFTGEVLAGYALVRGDQRDLDEALRLLGRAERIARGARDPVREAVLHAEAGHMLAGRGRYSEAARRFERAARLNLSAGETESQILALEGMGQAWLALQDPVQARPPLAGALALLESTSLPRVHARVLDGLARASLMEWDLEAARSNALAALDAAEALGDSALVRGSVLTLGAVALAAGELETARACYERCAATGDFGVRARIENLVNLALVASRDGRPVEARSHSEQALAAADGTGDPDLVWAALVSLGDTEERAGNAPAAIAHYRHAASVADTLHAPLEPRSVISAFSGRRVPFEALVHLLAASDKQYPDSGFVTEAFIWSERAKMQGLSDIFVASNRPVPRLRPMTRDGAQALLGRDDAMLVYSLGDSSSVMWVLTQKDWDFIVLKPRRALHARVAALRRGLSHPVRAVSMETRKNARMLQLLLVEPARRLIDDKDHLIIAPEGLLSLIPFEVFLTNEPPEGDGRVRKDDYLVGEFDVSYTPSVTALAAIEGRTVGGGIVVLGDPLFSTTGDPDGGSLEALPNTAAELAVIQQSVGNRDIEILVGAEATRSRLLASRTLADAQVIHLATHAIADEADPPQSGLYLAVEGGQPGFLSVPDVLRLDLRAALVTLSQCETGLGAIERGEGVLGISRAFMAAGANSVLASLWKVESASTAMLLREFYQSVLKKKRNRSEALADAKRRLLRKKETRSPYYWAPFVLVGADGPLEE